MNFYKLKSCKSLLKYAAATNRRKAPPRRSCGGACYGEACYNVSVYRDDSSTLQPPFGRHSTGKSYHNQEVLCFLQANPMTILWRECSFHTMYLRKTKSTLPAPFHPAYHTAAGCGNGQYPFPHHPVQSSLFEKIPDIFQICFHFQLLHAADRDLSRATNNTACKSPVSPEHLVPCPAFRRSPSRKSSTKKLQYIFGTFVPSNCI